MSAGHGHSRMNERHAGELAEKLSDSDVRRMLMRPFTIDVDHDVPDLCGYSVMGDVYFVDRQFVAAVRLGQVKIDGKPVTMRQLIVPLIGVPGQPMKPGHERIEKCLLDALMAPYWYPDAHEFATVGEHENAWSVLRWRPKPYEDALHPFIKRAAVEKITQPPLNLDCQPYLDSPDADDKVILKRFRALGVKDAEKVGRESVKYGKGKPTANCGLCRHYQGKSDSGLCEIVSGLQRAPNWCERFEARNEARSAEPAAAAAPGGVG